MNDSANDISPWSQFGAKFGLGARLIFSEPDDSPWSQISGIWLPWSQLGNPVLTAAEERLVAAMPREHARKFPDFD